MSSLLGLVAWVCKLLCGLFTYDDYLVVEGTMRYQCKEMTDAILLVV